MNESEVLTAMRIASDIADKGSPSTIRVLAAHLQRDNSSTKCAAIESLAKVAEEDDQRIIVMLSAYLADGNARVRAVAEEAVKGLENRCCKRRRIT